MRTFKASLDTLIGVAVAARYWRWLLALTEAKLGDFQQLAVE